VEKKKTFVVTIRSWKCYFSTPNPDAMGDLRGQSLQKSKNRGAQCFNA